MNTPPRKRRRRPQQESSEEIYESPRKRTKKKSSGNNKKKKSTKPNVPIGLIVAIAGTAVVLIAIMVVDWKSIGPTVGVTNTHESLMERTLSYQSEQNDILASINDEASAQAAGPKLIALAEEMAKTSFELREQKKAENIPLKDSMALKNEITEKLKPITARLIEELKRLAKNPALGATMKNMMREAHTTRLRVTKELQLNKAKEEANADGYSAVSSSTELTKGMRIQFIDPFNQWSNGDIKDIRNDGKVAVRTPFEFLDRDRLRIPDE